MASGLRVGVAEAVVAPAARGLDDLRDGRRLLAVDDEPVDRAVARLLVVEEDLDAAVAGEVAAQARLAREVGGACLHRGVAGLRTPRTRAASARPAGVVSSHMRS